MKRLANLAFTMLILVTVSSCAGTPANMGASDYPYLTQGSKFGVSIGMERAKAKRVLEGRGQTYFAATNTCEEDKIIDKCPNGSVIDSFLVSKFFQNGAISLVIVDEKVVAIAWFLDSYPVL